MGVASVSTVFVLNSYEVRLMFHCHILDQIYLRMGEYTPELCAVAMEAS